MKDITASLLLWLGHSMTALSLLVRVPEGFQKDGFQKLLRLFPEFSVDNSTEPFVAL